MAKVQESLSWVPIKLYPFDGDTKLSVATGFYYEHEDRNLLITNYHVVSGINPHTSEILDPHGRVPDSIGLLIPIMKEDEDEGSYVQWKAKGISLYNDQDNVEQTWFEHPEYGRRYDVVAIPVEGLEEYKILPANSEQHTLMDIRIYPSMDSFVIGYPRGMSGGGNLPIWKRATIASEPEVDIDDLPYFYIDTATREGMSGSPVYAQEVGYILPKGVTDKRKAKIGKSMKFVGIYSGRIGADDQFKAQLGIVWKKQSFKNLQSQFQNKKMIREA